MSRLTINMSALDKVECYFGERTVLDLYGDSCDVNHSTLSQRLAGVEIYSASLQTLLMSSLTSFSFIDENNPTKIRSGPFYSPK